MIFRIIIGFGDVAVIFIFPDHHGFKKNSAQGSAFNLFVFSFIASISRRAYKPCK